MSDLPLEGRALHKELALLLDHAVPRRRHLQVDIPTTVTALARAIRRSPASVYTYINGEAIPSAEVLDDILRALDAPPEEFGRFADLREEALAARRHLRQSLNLPVELDPPIDNLRSSSPIFVGRDVDSLARLIDVHGQVAIHGDGGVGKTELALQYAHQRRGNRRVIWWIDADSPRQITTGLAELARRHRPQLKSKDAVAAEWAVKWLRTHDQWLLLLDNVASFGDITDILSELRDCGGIVVTTRLRPGVKDNWQTGLWPLELDRLERQASVELLLMRADSVDRTGAQILASEVGDLPLAIVQAAAYVAKHPEKGFREYQQLLADYYDTQAAATIVGESTGRTAHATWNIAYSQATIEAPLAAEIATVLSYIAGTSLPIELLTTLGEPTAVDQALDYLASYRLIDRGQDALSVHRITQAAARLSDPRPEAHLAQAVNLIVGAIPSDPLQDVDGWPRWRTLIPHIEAVTSRIPDEGQNPETLQLRERYATFLQGQGHVSRALTVLASVVDDAARVLGSHHTETLEYTANLAFAYMFAGRISLALPILQDMVPAFHEAFGQADVETFKVRSLLAEAHRLRGNPETAARLTEGVIADAQGTDFDLALARTFLAMAYTDARQFDRAIPIFVEALAEQTDALGDEHPATLVSRHNLARAMREQGQLNAALAEFTQILAIQIRILGETHPHTLATRGNLALTEQALGEFDRAITHFGDLLVDTQEVLGREHPKSLTTRRYLASAQLANGDLDQAITLLEQAVADHHRLLGDLEPLTFLTRRLLAAAYQNAAARTLADLLRDQEHVLGPDHPDSIKTRDAATQINPSPKLP